MKKHRCPKCKLNTAETLLYSVICSNIFCILYKEANNKTPYDLGDVEPLNPYDYEKIDLGYD